MFHAFDVVFATSGLQSYLFLPDKTLKIGQIVLFLQKKSFFLTKMFVCWCENYNFVTKICRKALILGL